MGILDCFMNVGSAPCIWFEGNKNNALISMLSGLLFFSGWWALIDCATVHPGQIPAAHWICGVAGTLSLLMVNSISNAQMRGDSYEGGCMGTRGARIWIFLGFVMGFAAVIASCTLLFTVYTAKDLHSPGVTLFVQNCLICISSLLFKFGRTEDNWG